MEHEFYRGLAQRVRDIVGRADPFIKRRLLKLAERYTVKGIRREPAPKPRGRCRSPALVFTWCGVPKRADVADRPFESNVHRLDETDRLDAMVSCKMRVAIGSKPVRADAAPLRDRLTQ